MVKGSHTYKLTPFLLCDLQCLWHIVAAVLQFGQVEYETGEEGHAKIRNRNLLSKISKVCLHTEGKS